MVLCFMSFLLFTLWPSRVFFFRALSSFLSFFGIFFLFFFYDSRLKEEWRYFYQQNILVKNVYNDGARKSNGRIDGDVDTDRITYLAQWNYTAQKFSKAEFTIILFFLFWSVSIVVKNTGFGYNRSSSKYHVSLWPRNPL